MLKKTYMHLSQKHKGLPQLFGKFFKSTLNFEHYQKNIILIAYRFPTLRTTKGVVR